MSMDYEKTTGGVTGNSITDSELMPSVPIWETRGKKRRGMGRSAAPTPAPEPRTFAEDREVEVMSSGPATVAVDPYTSDLTMNEPALAAPIGRTRTTTSSRKSGVAPAGVAAGLVALAAVGAAGWYVTRGNDNSVPELTPGATAPIETAATPTGLDPATNTLPQPASEPRMQVSASAPAPGPAVAPRAAPPTRVASARVRPAAPSAASSGINASASAAIPAGPQAYSALNPSAPTPDSSTTTVNPVAPPAQAAPPATPEAPATQPPPTDTPTPQAQTPPQ